MKKLSLYLVGGVVLIAIVFFWILFVAVYAEGAATYYPLSPEEAKKNKLFIRMLSPEPQEISYNDKYDLIIQKAWLEYKIGVGNKTFWISAKPSEKVILKLVFAIREKSSGLYVEDYAKEHFSVVLSDSKGKPVMTRYYKNVVSKNLAEDIYSEHRVVISDGENTGTSVLFK